MSLIFHTVSITLHSSWGLCVF